MFLTRFLRKKTTRLEFSRDLPENEHPQLSSELKACADRRGGSLKNARRAQALIDLFRELSPTGKSKFAELLKRLGRQSEQLSGDRYTEIEEAEYFGGSESKLAVLDMFETTRRRVLMNLGDADSGRATLQEIKGLAGTDLDEDIAEVLSRKGSN